MDEYLYLLLYLDEEVDVNVFYDVNDLMKYEVFEYFDVVNYFHYNLKYYFE